jgi:hypothetical protein
VIRCIEGINGSGKSLLAADLVAKWPGPVATNLPLNERHPKFRSALRLGTHRCPVRCVGEVGVAGRGKRCCGAGVWSLSLRNTLILIDEAQEFFPCEQFSELVDSVDPDCLHPVSGKPLSPAAWFTHHRKWGLEIYFTTPRSSWLWNKVRGLVGEFIVCRRQRASELTSHWSGMFVPDSLLGWERVGFEDEGHRHPTGNQAVIFRKHASRLFGTFDTHAVVSTQSECFRCCPVASGLGAL